MKKAKTGRIAKTNQIVNSMDLIKKLGAKKGKMNNLFDGMNFNLTKKK